MTNLLTDHIHNLIVPHFDAAPICRLCGLTEMQIIRIHDDRKRGTPDGTQRTTEQATKPGDKIS